MLENAAKAKVERLLFEKEEAQRFNHRGIVPRALLRALENAFMRAAKAKDKVIQYLWVLEEWDEDSEDSEDSED